MELKIEEKISPASARLVMSMTNLEHIHKAFHASIGELRSHTKLSECGVRLTCSSNKRFGKNENENC